ncbi:clavesin-1-like [Toxorhynchites rutilus septentrionalis]|uniref:clavesin-1-like n=1 Tax=Toxorhynchites rutilus septentrionalis TaxID=329112 RepID=UPI0024792CB7|nr:clavesin-1-like [Toxorhynchites rutilus septentrionalis]
MLGEICAPCLDKAPEKYDDRLAEMDEFFTRLAREFIREDPEIREQSLRQLRDWIAKHPYIKKVRTDAPFLLRFLRTKKYNFINSSKMLERYLAARVLHRKWFSQLSLDEPDLCALVDAGYLFPLPERDSKGRTLIFSNGSGVDPTKFSGVHACRIHMLMAEMLHDLNEVQCGGFVLIYDFSKITLAHVNIVSFSEMRMMARVLNNATPMRTQEVHIVNTPGVAVTVANFALQLANEKLRSRVFCHRNWEELYAKVDRNLLPKEYGGKISQAVLIENFKNRCREMRPYLLAHDEMDMEIATDSEYWKETSDAELESGAIGTFRKLQVD